MKRARHTLKSKASSRQKGLNMHKDQEKRTVTLNQRGRNKEIGEKPSM